MYEDIRKFQQIKNDKIKCMKYYDHNNKSNKYKATSGLFGAVFDNKVYLTVYADVMADVKLMDKKGFTEIINEQK